MINRVFTYYRHNKTKSSLQVLLLLFAFCFSLPGYANTLTASVDRDTLAVHETLTLTLRYSGSTNETPDFSPLRRDFEIVSTSTQKMQTIINFTRETYTDWMVVLAPKRSGVYTIPSLTLGNAASQPILTTVKDQGTNDNVFVTVEANKKTAYVQEQIILKVRLYTAIQLDDIALENLELNNVVVVALDQKQTQITHNGRPHIMVENVYALLSLIHI